MCVHGITLLADALARVKFGSNQLCLNTTDPTPADLLSLHNFIWRCEVLCTICKLSDAYNRVQCLSVDISVMEQHIFPLPYVLNYANCL